MALLIDQVGLQSGVPGRARNDGLPDGSVVTLTDTKAGGTTVFALLWTPLQDSTALPSLAATNDPHIWTFTPTPSVRGAYRIRLTHTDAGQSTTEIRIFGIADATGAIPPAPGERSDPTASLLNATDPVVISRCERNWPTDDFPAGNPFGWGLEVIGGGGGSGVDGPAQYLALSPGEGGGPDRIAVFQSPAPAPGQVMTAVSNSLGYWLDPAIPTAEQIGLGDVTNDAQLVRADGDFSTFPPKTTPTIADLLLIEDAAAGGAKKRTTLGQALGLGSPSVGGETNPILMAPSSPNSFDDEFNSGSPDLAVRGWTVMEKNNTGGPLIPMTRVGDVDPIGTALVSGTYRSTIRGSVLYFQTGSTGDLGVGNVYIFKPQTGPARYAARVTKSHGNGSPAGGVYQGWYVFLNKGSGTAYYMADSWRRAGIEQNQSQTPVLNHWAVTGTSTNYNRSNNIDGGTYGGGSVNPNTPGVHVNYVIPDVVSLDTGANTVLYNKDYATWWDSTMLGRPITSAAENQFALDYTRAGILLQYGLIDSSSDLATKQSNIFSIDFIRRMPVFGWWV